MVDLHPIEDEQSHSEESKDANAQMRALHHATLSLYTDLSVEGVLQRIVAAARTLTNARYAAVGISNSEEGLETFITDGMDDEEIERIPHPPQGLGLLGEMIRSQSSIRVPEIAEHPKSYGFPKGHPVMKSFLGVPIAAFGRPIGQIYLTDKQDAPEFTEQDQQMIELLAAQSGAAIVNAQLYQQVKESKGGGDLSAGRRAEAIPPCHARWRSQRGFRGQRAISLGGRHGGSCCGEWKTDMDHQSWRGNALLASRGGGSRL